MKKPCQFKLVHPLVNTELMLIRFLNFLPTQILNNLTIEAPTISLGRKIQSNRP